MFDFLKKLARFYWFALTGMTAIQPIWDRKSGNGKISVFNNRHAALRAARPQDKVISGNLLWYVRSPI